MGKIKDDIKKFSRENGGKTKARTKAEEWFEKGTKSRSDKTVARTTRPFVPGKIYVFKYEKPKGIDRLPWWDMNPVVLALDPTDNKNDLGINLNLLPVKVKEDLLDFVYEQMKSQIENQMKGKSANNANVQRELKFTYDGAKKFLAQYGFDFAIRQYIPNLKADQKVVAYESWAKIVLCDFMSLNGTTIAKVQEAFRNHLKK
jgi:hypothetical protein